MDEDKERLKDFMKGAHDLLDIMVNDIHLLAPEQEDIHALVKKSWEEVNSIFNNARTQINKGNVDPEKLIMAGLSGPQLELKYQVYKREKDLFDKEWREIRESSEPERKSWWARIKHSRLLKLIKVIDNILDSLSAVVPVFHAVKEFKNTLDSVISK